jgi:hypothetical protein
VRVEFVRAPIRDVGDLAASSSLLVSVGRQREAEEECIWYPQGPMNGSREKNVSWPSTAHQWRGTIIKSSYNISKSLPKLTIN